RCAVVRVEDADQCLVRMAVPVLWEQRHQLAGKAGGGQIRRHGAEEAVALREGGDPWRHRGIAGTEIGVRRSERVDERVEIEQLAHFGLREDDQDRRLSKPRACWFQGTRCVTPAQPTRSRLARYQS